MINPNAPALDHNAVYSIYDRVVRNLPFLLSDSIIGTSPIVGLDLPANTITIAGDMGESTPTTVQTPTSLYGVVSINYDNNTDTTIIEVSDINVPIPNGTLLSYLIVLQEILHLVNLYNKNIVTYRLPLLSLHTLYLVRQMRLLCCNSLDC